MYSNNFKPMQQQPPPSSAINKNQMDYSPSLRFSQAWYSSRTCFTKPENISTTAEVRPKHVVLTTRGVSSSAAGPEGFNLKPKTIGVGPRTSTPTLLVLLIPATDKKKSWRLLSKCFPSLSLGESMYRVWRSFQGTCRHG